MLMLVFCLFVCFKFLQTFQNVTEKELQQASYDYLHAAGRNCFVLFIKTCLLSWTESPLERSALCIGEEEQWQKAPWEYFRTVPAGSFHLREKGRNPWHLLQNAFQRTTIPCRGLPSSFYGTPQPLMLSAGVSLSPSVFQLPMESPRQKSPVPILGVSLAVPRRLCRELSSPLLLRFPFLNESWAGAGRAAAAESQLWPLTPPVPAGQTKQVQSHHERREGERMPCAPWNPPPFFWLCSDLTTLAWLSTFSAA